MRGTRKRLSEALARRLGFTPAAQETPPAPLSISAPILPPQPARDPGRERGVRLSFGLGHKSHPDHASFEASADPQDDSSFFNALPAEIRRLVYSFMWRTGGDLYGIHILRETRESVIRSGPCSLHPEHSRAIAEANAELDAWFDRKGVDEEKRLRGVLLGIKLKADRLQELVYEMERTHLECHDDGVYGARNAARFRTGEGVDPLALWSPFFPVLLTCKRMYLESVDTIFRDLPPIFDPKSPDGADSLLCLNPHPSIHNLRTVTFSSDHYMPTDRTPGSQLLGHPRPMKRLINEDDSSTWRRVFNALQCLPSLREIRLSLRLDPVHRGDADLRPLAWCAGRLAAKFVVDLMPAENRRVNCRACGEPPRTFILPAENNVGDGGGGDGRPVGGRPLLWQGMREDCPPFGRVVWHEALRYVVERDRFPQRKPVVRALSRELCLRCNQKGGLGAGTNTGSHTLA